MTQQSDPAAHDPHREATEGFGDWSDDDFVDDDDESGATRGSDGPRRFLTDMADALRAAGLAVEEDDGWKERSSRLGGYRSQPIGIVVHHTASPRSWNGHRDVEYITRDHTYAPLANLYLDREGRWFVLAAGRTNTNGKGGPWRTIQSDQANHTSIGIEAGNNGTGEPWPEVMQDAYVKGVAALADQYDIDTENVVGHHEWAPTRKVDPAGPSQFGSINSAKTWDMNKFRAAVGAARGGSGTVEVIESTTRTVDGDTYVVRSGDSWWSIAEQTIGDPGGWKALAAANGGEDRVLLAGAVLTIPRPAGAGGGTAQTAAGPAFPGEAERGMKGPIVVAWQEALIARGVIADNHGNRDGEYGEGLERAVLKLQKSWGWSDADGVAGSGTWTKLHS